MVGRQPGLHEHQPRLPERQPDNAVWFYDTSKRGDIVEVINTVGSTLSGTDGLGDWNIPWEQWRAGNANI